MITDSISKIIEGKDLTKEEAEQTMNEIMKGEATEAQIASFLTALRMKGETVEEIASFARVMRANAIRIIPKVEVFDTCGTGGDKIKTFNVSTTVAFVLAGAGLHIAKHGNRAVTSKAGSADVLEALGVNLSIQAGEVATCVEKIGIGFLFAPLFHPAMKFAIKPRREIKIRTVFNILGPLTNPFGAKRQILGVYSKELVPKMASVLKELDCERGFVVHGLDGLDEVSVTGKTLICEITNKITKKLISPSSFGLKKAKVKDILGGYPQINAKILASILEGEKGARRDMVLVNSSLGLVAGGKASNLKDGVEVAKESIDSGNALKKLKTLIKESKGDMHKLESFLS
ncbi:anthranilate phosphoribosyltransferase [Candidatus Micrarchaeota archaeon]|nr:anthranilate phosphoribosyltransferase [Candidatus Micrarchaeota archaeon]